MGISANPLHFLVHTNGEFGKTLTLGHQDNNLPKNKELIEKIFNEAGVSLDVDEILAEKYADKIFKYLGCTELKSMDVSKYEGADIIHDMNKLIDEKYWGQFDTVIDGGTLEHVYHIPNAFNNIARLLRIGGRFIGMSPANNWLGHGFYQFSPELMWRFCKGFGFKVNRIDLYPRNGYPEPTSVPDPEVVGSRLTFNTPPNLIDLMTDAIKVEDKYPDYLYQSDYQTLWKKSD